MESVWSLAVSLTKLQRVRLQPAMSRLRERSHYAGEMWKRSFISARLGLPSTFRWSVRKRRNLKTPDFRFRVRRESIFKNELFENDGVTIIIWFPWPSFPQTQWIQNNRWMLRFWTENIWCVFRVKCSVFKFLRCSVDGAWRLWVIWLASDRLLSKRV